MSQNKQISISFGEDVEVIEYISRSNTFFFYIRSTAEKMQVVQVKINEDTKQNVLLVSKNEWKRLNRILTKKDDDKTEMEMAKRFKNERCAMFKSMAGTWGNSELLVYIYIFRRGSQ